MRGGAHPKGQTSPFEFRKTLPTISQADDETSMSFFASVTFKMIRHAQPCGWTSALGLSVLEMA